MKKIIITLLINGIFSTSLFAFDVSIGAKAGYFVWDPYLKEFDKEIKKGDGILFGPMLSIGLIDNLSLSAILLVGKQSTQWSSENKHEYASGYNIYKSSTSYINITRMDVDSTLNYRIDNLSLFIGYKYQTTTLIMQSTSRIYVQEQPAQSRVYHNEQRFKSPSHGPGIGAGYVLPIRDPYFIIANISGIYLRGELDVDDRSTYYLIEPETDFNNPNTSNSSMKIDLEMAGLNFEPASGIRIDDYGFVIFGLRYQLLKTKLKFSKEYTGEKPDDWFNDQIYGFFVSILYTF